MTPIFHGDFSKWLEEEYRQRLTEQLLTTRLFVGVDWSAAGDYTAFTFKRGAYIHPEDEAQLLEQLQKMTPRDLWSVNTTSATRYNLNGINIIACQGVPRGELWLSDGKGTLRVINLKEQDDEQPSNLLTP